MQNFWCWKIQASYFHSVPDCWSVHHVLCRAHSVPASRFKWRPDSGFMQLFIFGLQQHVCHLTEALDNRSISLINAMSQIVSFPLLWNRISCETKENNSPFGKKSQQWVFIGPQSEMLWTTWTIKRIIKLATLTCHLANAKTVGW